MKRTKEQIEARIGRLQALMKRLRLELKLANLISNQHAKKAGTPPQANQTRQGGVE